MKVVILVNGDIFSTERIKKECSSADIIIAADGGANIAYREGLFPKYIIGDLDSVDEKVLNHFRDLGSDVDKYPREKDYVDTELCLDKAIELGADEIVYVGGIGNRIDHSIGNIHLLYKTIKKGVKSHIISETADVYICENFIEVYGNIGDTLSILPLFKPIKGITLKGLKYPLNNASFEFGDVFGTCNEFKCEKASIEISEGCLLVIKQYNI